MAERGLSVDHTTIWFWTQAYASEVQRRRRDQLKPQGTTWNIDEMIVKIADRWSHLFRAVTALVRQLVWSPFLRQTVILSEKYSCGLRRKRAIFAF